MGIFAAKSIKYSMLERAKISFLLGLKKIPKKGVILVDKISDII